MMPRRTRTATRGAGGRVSLTARRRRCVARPAGPSTGPARLPRRGGLGLLLEDAELIGVRLRHELAVDRLLLRLARLAVLDDLVGLLDGHLGDERGRLEHGCGHLALLDGRDRVRAAVEADDLDLLDQARSLERSNGTERHLVVASDDAVYVA